MIRQSVSGSRKKDQAHLQKKFSLTLPVATAIGRHKNPRGPIGRGDFCKLPQIPICYFRTIAVNG
jgi:hypothetical protein